MARLSLWFGFLAALLVRPASAADDLPVRAAVKVDRDPIRSLTFAPDGKILAVGAGKSLKLFEYAELKSGEPWSEIPADGRVAFTPSGLRIAVVCKDRGVEGVRFWYTKSGRMGETFIPAPFGVRDTIVVSPDGSKLSVGVNLYDTATGEGFSVGFKPFGSGPSGTRAFGEGGKTIIAVESGGEILRYDFKTEKVETVKLKGPGERKEAGELSDRRTLSPDGKWLADEDRTGVGGPGALSLWDTTTGEQRNLKRQDWDAEVAGFAFSSDGGYLAVWSEKGRVQVYNTADGRTVGTASGETKKQGPTTALAFTPDGKTLVAGTEQGKIALVGLPERKKP